MCMMIPGGVTRHRDRRHPCFLIPTRVVIEITALRSKERPDEVARRRCAVSPEARGQSPATSWPAWLAEIALLRRQVRSATRVRATSLPGRRTARSERQMS
jgi:hypothetical protein